MNVLTKTLGFSVVLISIFTAVTYVLPQMKGEAPEESDINIQELTMSGFVAMGEDLFTGKGNCSLCHNQLGRAPDLLAFDVTKKALQRLADTRYQGDAKDAEGYLRESMLLPSIYVAEGFGKKGSNDTESPMLAVDKPPTQLSEVEIDAIVAYLQSKDGNSITVSLPMTSVQSDDDPESPAQSESKVDEATPALAESPEKALEKYACGACHAILDSVSPVGPDLRNVGQRLSIGEIRDSILAPQAIIADGFAPIMPEFPNMTLSELDMIVGFLAIQNGDQ